MVNVSVNQAVMSPQTFNICLSIDIGNTTQELIVNITSTDGQNSSSIMNYSGR